MRRAFELKKSLWSLFSVFLVAVLVSGCSQLLSDQEKASENKPEQKLNLDQVITNATKKLNENKTNVKKGNKWEYGIEFRMMMPQEIRAMDPSIPPELTVTMDLQMSQLGKNAYAKANGVARVPESDSFDMEAFLVDNTLYEREGSVWTKKPHNGELDLEELNTVTKINPAEIELVKRMKENVQFTEEANNYRINMDVTDPAIIKEVLSAFEDDDFTKDINELKRLHITYVIDKQNFNITQAKFELNGAMNPPEINVSIPVTMKIDFRHSGEVTSLPPLPEEAKNASETSDDFNNDNSTDSGSSGGGGMINIPKVNDSFGNY